MSRLAPAQRADSQSAAPQSSTLDRDSRAPIEEMARSELWLHVQGNIIMIKNTYTPKTKVVPYASRRCRGIWIPSGR